MSLLPNVTGYLDFNIYFFRKLLNKSDRLIFVLEVRTVA